MRDTKGGAGYVIRNPNAKLLIVGGSPLFKPSILEVELRVAKTVIIGATGAVGRENLC